MLLFIFTFSLLLWDGGNPDPDKRQQFPPRRGGQSTWEVTSTPVTVLDTWQVPGWVTEGPWQALWALGTSWCLAPALGWDGRHLTHTKLTPCSAGQSSGWPQAAGGLHLSFCLVNIRLDKPHVGYFCRNQRSLCSVSPSLQR